MEHIFPFLWVRKNEQHKIAGELDRILESGIRAFCVESRVHEDFCGPSWWEDMAFILRCAKERNMQVWLLDDKSYPTGSAGGELAKYPELQAKHIKVEACDVVGPKRKVKVPCILNLENKDELLDAFMYKVTAHGIDIQSAVEVLPEVASKFAYIDVPEGQWRVCFFISTVAGWELRNYIDMLNPASVDVLVKTVYESHYEHFSEYFGETFVGFFSDEPRFSNGIYNGALASPTTVYEYTLGIFGMAYPVSRYVLEQFRQTYTMKDLVALWFPTVTRGSEIKAEYMRIITDEYGKNFPHRLSKWCHEHKVQYAGHIIEDMGAHTRTGCSAGHYFKSQQGADFAAVDIVLHQIKPGASFAHPAAISGAMADPLFFNNTLIKLASSCSNIDPLKEGRAICEMFGAYGWGESLRDMKWLLNHCLVRGINYFIPHAFSMVENDTDCPPHFYARGSNPSFEAYMHLWKYMDEMCRTFSGGHRNVSVAVLYNAENDWAGNHNFEMEKVLKVLNEHQIDFDILPEDALWEARVKRDCICVGQATYKCIVVPKYDYVTPRTSNQLNACEECIPIYRVRGERARNNLAGTLYTQGICRQILRTYHKDLRVMEYCKEDRHIFMFFNEGTKKIRTQLFNGAKLVLAPGEALVTEHIDELPIAPDFSQLRGRKVKAFDVYISETGHDFRFYKKVGNGFDINEKDELPNFTGYIKYIFTLGNPAGKRLLVTYSGESCKVKVGEQIYTAGDTDILCELPAMDLVQVEITLNNLLAYKQTDYFSKFNCIEGCFLERVELI